MRAIIDQGPFTAAQARQAGLVDELRFEDQMWGELKDRLHSGELKKVAAGEYMKVPMEAVGLQGKSRIALVVGEGDITRGEAGDDGSTGNSLTSYGFDKLLRQVAGDSTIKGVVVRIDSPGGEAGGFRRDLAADEPAEQEEAAGVFDVGPGGFGRILHRHDGRPHRGVSGDR